MVTAKREECGCWSIVGNCSNTVNSRYDHVCNFLSPHVPNPGLPVGGVSGILVRARGLSAPAPLSWICTTHPSEYCTIRPFFDQANQHRPGFTPSDLVRMRITLGGSVWGAFATLQTRRSPSAVCVASISDFCFDDDPCQDSAVIGEGALGDVSVCRMVNDGCSAAIRIEPF